MHLSAVVTALGPEWLQPTSILERFGTWALVAALVILFVECGLLIFFLPGDSLLFVVGLFTATGAIETPLWLALVLMSAAAVAGNLVGYWIGARVGSPLFERPNSKLIRPEHVARTHAFFERYGVRSVVLGRFVPIVRTFITALAGIARMDYRTYARYSAIGGVAWVVIVTMLGYVLGSRYPAIGNNIELIAVLIVAISLLPILFEFRKARRDSRSASDTLAPDPDL